MNEIKNERKKRTCSFPLHKEERKRGLRGISIHKESQQRDEIHICHSKNLVQTKSLDGSLRKTQVNGKRVKKEHHVLGDEEKYQSNDCKHHRQAETD